MKRIKRSPKVDNPSNSSINGSLDPNDKDENGKENEMSRDRKQSTDQTLVSDQEQGQNQVQDLHNNNDHSLSQSPNQAGSSSSKDLTFRITIGKKAKKLSDSDLQNLSSLPTSRLEEELDREKGKARTRRSARSLLLTLGTVAACAVLVATLWLPVLRIYGNSMTPTLQEGDLVVSMKQNSFETGDVIAFYYNNKILVKRVIAGPGDYVDLDEDGNVYVNGTLLDEPYLNEKAVGETDLEYPYQVPDNHWFVMGDHRTVSLDSRTKAIGTIDENDIVGKLVTRIWPLS